MEDLVKESTEKILRENSDDLNLYHKNSEHKVRIKYFYLFLPIAPPQILTNMVISSKQKHLFQNILKLRHHEKCIRLHLWPS